MPIYLQQDLFILDSTQCCEVPKSINFPMEVNWLFTNITALLDQGLDWH